MNRNGIASVRIQVEKALNGYALKYYLEETKTTYEYNIITEMPGNLVIRCSKSSEFVRISYSLYISPRTITTSRGRMLELCSLLSRGDFFNAKLYDEGINISYSIPDGADDRLERLLTNVLYNYLRRIDHKMLQLALTTEEDLVSYSEEKMKREVYGITTKC